MGRLNVTFPDNSNIWEIEAGERAEFVRAAVEQKLDLMEIISKLDKIEQILTNAIAQPQPQPETPELTEKELPEPEEEKYIPDPTNPAAVISALITGKITAKDLV